MSEPVTVTDQAAASVFGRSNSRAILFALMQAERSLTGLRDHLGFSLSLLHYHVDRLQRLGLVTIRRHDPRPGRPVAIYAAIADAFIVPSALEPVSPSAERHAQLQASLQRARGRCPDAATLFDLGDGQVPRMRRLASSRASAEGDSWWRLTLTDADAELLAQEIREVLAGYRSRSGSRGKVFLGYFALAQV